MELLYVTTKYIVAKNIKEALRKERDTEVHDCYLEKGSIGLFAEEKMNARNQKSPGFNTNKKK